MLESFRLLVVQLADCVAEDFVETDCAVESARVVEEESGNFVEDEMDEIISAADFLDFLAKGPLNDLVKDVALKGGISHPPSIKACYDGVCFTVNIA